jgi:hypothetical protein
MEELSKHNFAPERIGFVEKKGSWSVSFATDVSQFVASKVKLARLMGPPQRHDAAAPPASPTPAPSSTPPPSPPSAPPPASSDGSAVS